MLKGGPNWNENAITKVDVKGNWRVITPRRTEPKWFRQSHKGGTFSQGDGAINQLLVSKVPAFIYEMANKTIHNKERDNGKLSRKE